MGRVPIWAQWSIIGAGIFFCPVLLFLLACAFSWWLFRRLWIRPFAVTDQSFAPGSTNSRAICSSSATNSGSVVALPQPISAISSTPAS